jgi:hypothetical protein
VNGKARQVTEHWDDSRGLRLSSRVSGTTVLAMFVPFFPSFLLPFFLPSHTNAIPREESRSEIHDPQQTVPRAPDMGNKSAVPKKDKKDKTLRGNC